MQDEQKDNHFIVELMKKHWGKDRKNYTIQQECEIIVEFTMSTILNEDLTKGLKGKWNLVYMKCDWMCVPLHFTAIHLFKFGTRIGNIALDFEVEDSNGDWHLVNMSPTYVNDILTYPSRNNLLKVYNGMTNNERMSDSENVVKDTLNGMFREEMKKYPELFV